jgi:hypothetical protein
MTAFVIAGVLSGALAAAYQYHRVWTPLQRWYLWAYVRSGIALTSEGTYDVLQLVDTNERRPAVDDDVVPMTLGTADPVFVLTEAAQHAGRTQLAWQAASYPHAAFHQWLGRAIYSDQSLVDLAVPILWATVAVALGMAVGATAQRVVVAQAVRAWPSAERATWNVPPVLTVPVRDAEIAGATHLREPVSRPALPPPASQAPSPMSSLAVKAEVWPPHFFA